MANSWTEKIAALQDKREYQELNWEGSFDEYLELVRNNPRVTRTAYQRLYDMILSHGKTEYIDTGLSAEIVDVKEGQKLVVGRSSVEPSGALFVVLVAKVVN